MRGQINLTIATAMAVVSFVAAPIIAYYSAQSATNQRISEIDTQGRITTSQVNNLEKRLDKIELKLDGIETKIGQLLLKNGIK